MAEKFMPPANSLMLDNAKLADVAARLAELDPQGRYEVTIRRARTREDICANLAKISEDASGRAKAAGLTADELAGILEMDDAERRNLLG